MDHNGGSGPPYRPSAPPEHKLSHRISNLSDITDLDNYEYDDRPTGPLRGRESLVSLQSLYNGPLVQSPSESTDVGTPFSASSWHSSPFAYTGGAGGYQPVSTGSVSSIRSSRAPSRGLSMKRPQPETIPEEFDLSLLRSAAPISGASAQAQGRHQQYDPVAEVEPAVDLSTTLGPTTSADEVFVKKLQEQEANGKLTGGLGAGLRIDTTMTTSDLLRSPVTLKRSLTKSLTRRGSITPQQTDLRGLGQEEANRSGKVIEVVMDEPTEAAGVDISQLVGPDIQGGEEHRSSIVGGTKRQQTQIFYPQLNWKPWSMRWPYLVFLVALSIFLAIGQEMLYQQSLKQPLLSFRRPTEVPGISYFAIKFLPTMIAVSYGVLWQFVDFEVKRLEAYYQLSQEGGALAAESINVDYITSFNLLRPFRALVMKHYAVAISSLATFLAVSLVPTFSAASIELHPDHATRITDPDGEKTIVLNATWSRFLTGTLAACGVFACMLFYQLQTRKSGLMADVKGIAGLASLANKSHILVDFQDLDTVKHTDLHQRLKHRRYVLRNSSLAPDDENPVSKKDRDRFQKHHLSENPHPLMLRAAGSIPFLVGILLFSAFIPVFLFTPAVTVTERAAWVVTALAVCIKLCWGSLETDVRMMEPFYILSRRHAPPRTLTLDYTAVPFGYLPIRAFLNGHILVALVGLGSVIAELLTVVLTSLATVNGRDFIGVDVTSGPGPEDNLAGGAGVPTRINSGEETPLSFWISLAVALFILVYMFAIAAVVFLRRRHPFLPRQPNTIASILAYIHQSKMLYDFVGTEKLSNEGMARRLDEIGKTYGLGWFEGRDGQTHCGVDSEELISNYKHGIVFSDGIKPWNSQWEYL